MPKKVKTQLRSGDILPPLERSYDLNRESLDTEARTVSVVFSTENPVSRWFGDEVLDHSKGAARMERLNDGGPFLMDHDSRDQRGVIEFAKMVGREGHAKIRFSESDRGEELMMEVKTGIRQKISFAYRIHELEITERRNEPDLYRATDWEGHEISSVAIPADLGAGTREEAVSIAERSFGTRTADLSTRVQITHHKTPPTMTKKEQEAREAALRAAASELKVSDDTLARAIGDESVTVEAFREANKIEPEAETSRTVTTATDAIEPKPEAKREIDLNDPKVKKEIRGEVTAEIEYRGELDELRKRYPEHYSEKDHERDLADKPEVAAVKLRVLESQEKANRALSFPRENTETSGKPGSKERTMNELNDQAVTALRNAGFKIDDVAPVAPFESEREVIAAPNILIHRTLTGVPNLVDVAHLDAGIGSSIIEESIGESREVEVFPVDTITGASIDLSVRTGLPTVGARNANEGRDYKKGTFEPRNFQTCVIEEPIGIDIQGVLNASKNPGRVLNAEANAVTSAVLQHIGVQTWYAGTAQSGADTKFPPGIISQSNSAATHVLDAGGNSEKTSVWFLRLGVESVDHVYGNDTTLNMSDFQEETLFDSNNKKLRGLQAWLSGRVAVRVANKNSAVRIKNIEEDTLTLTDAMMFNALKLFRELKAGQPNAIFMTPRSQYQLRASRTATNITGAPAPMPREFEGIPIYDTNNISNAETV